MPIGVYCAAITLPRHVEPGLGFEPSPVVFKTITERLRPTEWCAQGDLNPHVLADTRSLVWRVCQFHHKRMGPSLRLGHS